MSVLKVRTDLVVAVRVALRAFQLSSSSRNISWLTYLALSIVVSGQIKESWLPFGHASWELIWSSYPCLTDRNEEPRHIDVTRERYFLWMPPSMWGIKNGVCASSLLLCSFLQGSATNRKPFSWAAVHTLEALTGPVFIGQKFFGSQCFQLFPQWNPAFSLQIIQLTSPQGQIISPEWWGSMELTLKTTVWQCFKAAESPGILRSVFSKPFASLFITLGWEDGIRRHQEAEPLRRLGIGFDGGFQACVFRVIFLIGLVSTQGSPGLTFMSGLVCLGYF